MIEWKVLRHCTGQGLGFIEWKVLRDCRDPGEWWESVVWRWRHSRVWRGNVRIRRIIFMMVNGFIIRILVIYETIVGPINCRVGLIHVVDKVLLVRRRILRRQIQIYSPNNKTKTFIAKHYTLGWVFGISPGGAALPSFLRRLGILVGLLSAIAMSYPKVGARRLPRINFQNEI